MLINADMQKQKAPPALAGRAFRVIKLHVMLNLFQHLKQTLKQVQGDELYLTTSFTVLIDFSVTIGFIITVLLIFIVSLSNY